MTKHKIGATGQQAAESFLQKKGYNVLARNFRKKFGEIDLVMQDGEYVVFVEVKARSALTHGHPREAVGSTKQKRIIETAQAYLAQHMLTDIGVRFDVVEVLMQHGQVYVSHIENAFQ